MRPLSEDGDDAGGGEGGDGGDTDLGEISVGPGDSTGGDGSAPPSDSSGGTAPVGGDGGGTAPVGGDGGGSTPVQQTGPGSTTTNTQYGSVTIGDDVNQNQSDITTENFDSMFKIYTSTRVGKATNGAIAGSSDTTFVRVNENLITTEEGAYLRIGDRVDYVSPTANHALQISYNTNTNTLNISNVPVVNI